MTKLEDEALLSAEQFAEDLCVSFDGTPFELAGVVHDEIVSRLRERDRRALAHEGDSPRIAPATTYERALEKAHRDRGTVILKQQDRIRELEARRALTGIDAKEWAETVANKMPLSPEMRRKLAALIEQGHLDDRATRDEGGVRMSERELAEDRWLHVYCAALTGLLAAPADVRGDQDHSTLAVHYADEAIAALKARAEKAPNK